MTRDEALRLIDSIPEVAFTEDFGMGRGANHGYVERLRTRFPEFNWRIILDQSGQYTRWVLTIDDNDPREHFVPVRGTCSHCGKTARQLGVKERDVDGYEVEPATPGNCIVCDTPLPDVGVFICEKCNAEHKAEEDAERCAREQA